MNVKSRIAANRAAQGVKPAPTLDEQIAALQNSTDPRAQEKLKALVARDPYQNGTYKEITGEAAQKLLTIASEAGKVERPKPSMAPYMKLAADERPSATQIAEEVKEWEQNKYYGLSDIAPGATVKNGKVYLKPTQTSRASWDGKPKADPYAGMTIDQIGNKLAGDSQAGLAKLSKSSADAAEKRIAYDKENAGYTKSMDRLAFLGRKPGEVSNDPRIGQVGAAALNASLNAHGFSPASATDAQKRIAAQTVVDSIDLYKNFGIKEPEVKAHNNYVGGDRYEQVSSGVPFDAVLAVLAARKADGTIGDTAALKSIAPELKKSLSYAVQNYNKRMDISEMQGQTGFMIANGTNGTKLNNLVYEPIQRVGALQSTNPYFTGQAKNFSTWATQLDPRRVDGDKWVESGIQWEQIGPNEVRIAGIDYNQSVSWKQKSESLGDVFKRVAAVPLAGFGALVAPALAGSLSSALGPVGSEIAAGAIIGGGRAALTGGDIGQGILTGGVGGAITGSGIAKDIAGSVGGSLGIDSANGLSALTTGVSVGLKGTAGSLIQGNGFGDALESGIISGLAAGAGAYVGQTVKDVLGGTPASNIAPDGKTTIGGVWTPENSGSAIHDKPTDNWYTDNTEGNPVSSNLNLVNTAANAASGATTGLINLAGRGTDIGNGVLVGAAAGAANGLVQDLGGSNVVAGVVGGAAGTAVNNAVNTPPTPVTPTRPSTGGNTPPTRRPFGSVTDDMFGFGSVVFQDLSKNRNVNFNARKFGG